MLGYIKRVLYVVSVTRRQLYCLLIFFAIASIFEAFGVSLIGPFLALVANPSIVYGNPVSANLFNFMGVEGDRGVVFAAGCLLIGLYVLKTFVYFLSRHWIIRYSFLQKHLLIDRLVEGYLKAPYVFHLNRNSSDLMENIIVGSNQFSTNCMVPLLEMISNVVVAVFLVAVLAKTDILFFVLILLIFLPTGLAVILLSKLQKKWGKRQTLAQKGIMKSVNHALGGLKETKVIGCEDYFRHDVSIYSKEFFNTATKNGSAHWIPRILLEGSLLILVVVYILVSYLYKATGVEELASVMGIFAAASIRLIPASSQASQAIGRLQNSSYIVRIIYSDLRELEQSRTEPKNSKVRDGEELHLEESITVENISYYYPNSAAPAVNNVSLTIKKGQSVGLVGKSGSGKTTLVDILLGLLIPQSGDIKIDGSSIYDNMLRWQNLLGYIPQSIFLTDDTIKQNVAYGVPKNLIDEEKVMMAIKAAQLEDVVNSFPEGMNTFVGERGIRLSGGQRQRIGIARALYHNCEILILDEATSALDSETETLISDAINSLAGTKTLIIIAHRYSTIQSCDFIYKLEKGQLVKSGSYEEVILSESK